MYVPRFFKPHELVPPDVYKSRGRRSLELVDERVLVTLDNLRARFGPIVINDWYWKGKFRESGLRTPGCSYYSPTSQHTFGRAMDCHFHKVTSEAVRQYVLAHRNAFPHISFMETDISWFHFDVRNCRRIMLWSPETKKLRKG